MRAGLIAALLVAGALAWGWSQRAPEPEIGAAAQVAPTGAAEADRDSRRSHSEADRWPAFLPAEAVQTLQRIEAGGPFEHRQDGAVFQNRERRLPQQARGYYHEYTVETPGSRDRGARRIVSGGEPPVEYFYTDDHYGSFRRFEPEDAR
jgi:guanyl-specific ribonuclease Sa